jgi:hypothetical protein
MAGNPWLGALTGFESGFSQGVRNVEQSEEEKRRQQFEAEQEKQRQQDETTREETVDKYKFDLAQKQANQTANNDQNIISQLVSGKVANPDYTQGNQLTLPGIGGVAGNITIPKVDYSPLNKMSAMQLITGLSPKGSADYEHSVAFMEKQADRDAEDQANKIIASGQKLTDQDLANLPAKVLNKLKSIKEIDKQPKPESVSLGHETDYKANRIIERKGYLNPNADPKDPSTKIIDGKKYTVTSESSMGKAFKTADNGKKDFANATKTVYKDWETSLEKMNFRLQNNTDEKGNPLTQTDKDQREKDRAEYQARFAEKVKKEMPKSVKDWYENQFNAAKKQGLSIDAQTFWVRVKKAYENGDFSKNKDEENLAMRYLRELHYATYNEDPAKKYAGFSSDDDNDEDEDNE